MKRTIKKVAVLGSGVMGSRIACHFAGIGIPVLLLDVIAREYVNSDKVEERNKIVNNSLYGIVKSQPPSMYTHDVVKRISTGNFEDNMQDIEQCDWIIEAVTEQLDVKRMLYEKVEQHRKAGTLITSNTSGIPINLLSEGRSDDFKKHFCGTHFFNPPRYLRLLEIIPSKSTDAGVVDFLMHFGDIYLGKSTVLAKDTPAFIANRVGLFSIMNIFHIMRQMQLSVEEVDVLTGPVIGRPKSGTFRTADIVGIDTLVNVSNFLLDNCCDDEAKNTFVVPAWLNEMIDRKWFGDKTMQGFYKKVMPQLIKGYTEIMVLDLNSMEYRTQYKPVFQAVETAKTIENLKQRLQMLVAANDKAGEFYRKFHYGLFSYVSYRIPEISDELYRIDEAMMAGFGWEIGVFETWDALGVEETVKLMKSSGYEVAGWIEEMLANGFTSFYTIKKGNKRYYDVHSKSYKSIPGQDTFIILKNYEDNIIWKNNHAVLYNIGDDVAGLQWNTKMNTIGSEVLEALNKSIDITEEHFKGLVIANDGANFSAGANIGILFMLAAEQEFDELDKVIRTFQNTMMRTRYSSIPVVIAPHGLALGGGCEINLHADKVYAAAESYMGLVELAVGLIPAGGGTKEFVLRASDEMHIGEPETITLKNRFLTIATAKTATSAFEAYNMGILRRGYDEVIVNTARRITAAKRSAIDLYDKGYVSPVPRNDIKVFGKSLLGTMHAGIHNMHRGGYATEYDTHVAKKLATVMCGGELSETTFVSEQYLLDLEREAFLSLCGEKKTLERMQSVLQSGKPVRN